MEDEVLEFIDIGAMKMGRNIKIYGYIDKGYNGQRILVECSIRNGFPGFDITGLAGASIKEARERVRCALRSCGFKFPQSRILVNLSPASQHKDSTLLDLPLAIAILYSQTRTNQNHIDPFSDDETVNVMIAGELTLDGQVLQAPQALGALEAARRIGCQVCLVPFESSQVNEHRGIETFRVASLPQAFGIIGEIMSGNIVTCPSLSVETGERTIFKDIIGLEEQKETLAMAVAGFHSTLLFGPPGIGKTMLSTRLHLLLDPYSRNQADEVSRILGCSDVGETTVVSRERMRLLSHDCTQLQFCCGSSSKTPGEGALAHLGTLVLDEINKFPPKLIETIKDAYDKGYTQSSRSGEVITYPARFLMIGNMNPCPCSGLGDPGAICSCTAQKLYSHWSRIGRQMIERFDLRLPIPPQTDILSKLETPAKEDSHYIAKVAQAVARQNIRYRNIDDVDYNGQIHFSTKALMCLRKEMELFSRIQPQNAQSSRAQIGTVALARSIADYNDEPNVSEEHFTKALELRRYGLGDYYWRTIR